jgi:hypothetical protein
LGATRCKKRSVVVRTKGKISRLLKTFSKSVTFRLSQGRPCLGMILLGSSRSWAVVSVVLNAVVGVVATLVVFGCQVSDWPVVNDESDERRDCYGQ